MSSLPLFFCLLFFNYLSSVLNTFRIHIVISLILTTFISSCEKSVTPTPAIPISYKYLHISHTKGVDNTVFTENIESIDYSKYRVVMLGGDMMQSSTESWGVMDKIDSVFDISSENTLWTIGNHDDSNAGMIPMMTNRPLHYSYYKDGITYLVLNSEDDNCSIINTQLNLFNNVVDTIQESSHLVVLTHKLIWMSGNNNLEPIANGISNGPLGNATWEINPNNFYDDLYWKLLDVQNSGIQVICLGGDLGINATEYEYRFDSGIQFLASGVYHNNPIKKGLVFEHTPSTRSLTWEYVDLEDL